MRDLPGREAELLSVYFEELSAYRAKELRKTKERSSQSSPDHGRYEEVTEFELKDDDWDDNDYSEWLRLEQEEAA